MTKDKNSIPVSIIMATYNRSHFIIETLDSILKQSFTDWECLIIDDGSTDDTKEILQPYLKIDPRLKYFERNNNHKKGLPGCRNQGLQTAQGEFVVFFDDDDIVHPNLLELSIKEIVANKADYCRYLRTIFTGDFHYNFDNGLKYYVEHIDIKNLDEIIMNKIPFNSCQVVWRKSNFTNNKFNEDLMYAEEWECYSRILSTGINGVSINKILFYGRKHPNSNTGEFQNNDPNRKRSKIKAIKLVIENLSITGLLSKKLIHYFLRSAFSLQEISIIDHTLRYSGASKLAQLKYKLGFKYYGLIEPIFKIKGKVKKLF